MAAQSVGSPGSLRLDMTDESLRKQGPMMRQILSGVKKLRKWKLKFFIVEDNCLYSRAHEEAPVVKVAHLPSYTLKDLEKNKGRCLQLSRTGDKSAGDERIVVLPLSPEEREMWCIWLVEAGASPEDGSEAASFAGFTPVGRASIEPLLQRFPRASAAPEGGLLYNSAEVSEMRGHIMGFVKKIGADVLQGQDLTKIALPLEIFEPSSFLERLALDFTSAPTYLTKAAKCTNPVQRLEAVIAFIVAGMHRSPASPKKPVNPEVGETYQATLADGTRIFCEQLEKHPPVSAWLVLGDGYRFHGRGEFKANVRGNHIRTSFVGPHTIEFVDGTSVTWSVPDLWFCNIVWGARRAEWIGVAEVPSDFFTGRIFSLDKPDSAVRTIEVTYPKVARVREGWRQWESVTLTQGSWLSALEFDGRRAWDITDTSVDSVVTSAARPLPSDCTLRDDVIAMRSGNYALAESLRTRRREDRKEAKRKAKR